MAAFDSKDLLVAATFALASGVSACARGAPMDVAPPSTATSASLTKPELVAAGEVAVTGWRVLSRAHTEALATNDGRVYFGDEDSRGLFAVPKNGGDRIVIGLPAPRAIAFGAGSVVWIGEPGDLVVRAPRGGGPGEVIRRGGAYTAFTALAADDADVFVGETTADGGELMRITGPTATLLAAFESPPRAIALDATDVYVQTAQKILRVGRKNGDVSVVTNGTALSRLAIDADGVYMTDRVGPSRAVLRVAKAGGAGSVLQHGVRDAPIAVLGSDVYYFEADQPTLRRVSARGGASTIVARARELARVTALAIDESGIFVGTVNEPLRARGNQVGPAVVAMPVVSMPPPRR